MAANWYWLEEGEEKGPVSFRVLADMVRNQVLNEDDLVRPHYAKEWEKAYRVIGLFYMAQREPDPRSEDEKQVEPTSQSGTSDESGWWSERRERSHPFHLAELGIDGDDLAALEDAAKFESETAPETIEGSQTRDDVVEYTPDSEIAATIGEAVADWDRRHVLAPPPTENVEGRSWSTVATVLSVIFWPFRQVGSGFSALLGGILDICFRIGAVAGLGTLCRILERVASRQVLAWWFRGGAVVAGALSVGWGVHAWSRYQTLRFPKEAWIASGTTLFPIIGPCNPTEYAFLLGHAVIAGGVLGFLGACLLEQLADD